MPLGDRLYISTIGLGHRLGYQEVLTEYRDLDIDRVELGYVGEFEGSLSQVVDSFDFEYLCHNYCLPGPRRIINLASANDEIRTWSVNYVERAIKFCANHSIGLYTVHGGFRVDPTADLRFEGEPAPYDAAFDRFRCSIERLGAVAERHGVVLGIENNVVETHHLDEGENERLLFVRSAEFERLLDEVNVPNVGVLLDLGHLNVAAETLGFNRAEFESLAERIVAFHVHGNDGESDDHRPITDEDWSIRAVMETYSTLHVPVVIESHFKDVNSLAETYRRIRDLD